MEKDKSTARTMKATLLSSASQLFLLLLSLTACNSRFIEPSSGKSHKRHLIEHGSNNALANLSKIPGLYELNQLITPIQGQAHFERYVLQVNNDTHTSANSNADAILEPRNQTINLVQFYMATCPDCQGFSPYFKRFVSDIGPHWRHLVRISVVNCNDDLNINLCWQQNPNLVVPLVRWYTYPTLLLDSKRTKYSQFNYPKHLLNVAHRNYIEKQRRDLISLRHATLRFITATLDQLAHPLINGSQLDGIGNFSNDQYTNTALANVNLYKQLPTRWRLFQPIGRPKSRNNPEDRFLDDLEERVQACRKESQVDAGVGSSLREEESNVIIENFIIFERRSSFIGKTLVADWSNWTCAPELPVATENGAAKLMLLMIHYTNNFALLNQTKLVVGVDQERPLNLTTEMRQMVEAEEPMLFNFRLISNKQNKTITSHRQIQLKLVSSSIALEQTNLVATLGQQANMRRRRHIHQSLPSSSPPATNSKHEDYLASRLDRLSQRINLENFYTKRRSLNSNNRHPYKYAALMSTPIIKNQQVIRNRARRFAPTQTNNSIITNQLEAENINWAPQELYQNEEKLRYKFNKEIARFVFGSSVSIVVPGFEDGNLGEIKNNKSIDQSAVVSAKDDDLNLLRLTDYYKVLAEIVHKNLLSKAELDGYQLLSSACFLRQLARHFPFQGGSTSQSKSVARNYIEILHLELGVEFNKRLGKQFDTSCLQTGELSKETLDQLDKMKMASKEFEQIQTELGKKHHVGLPSEAHFKWSYCAGSSEYLRGHTCSLWILFHTLTVHEYLKTTTDSNSSKGSDSIKAFKLNTTTAEQPQLEYKFVVKYSSSNHSQTMRTCDPKNPEPALLNSSSRDLFIGPSQFALANIINFVRFYLSCTNCAAHFSCMVQRSPLNFRDPEPADHLLWLWEAHNQVNMRTRHTHSEDPLHPKHVFPAYEACPACYLEKPSETSELEAIKFNKREIVNFIVAKYHRSAILNNKIRIEDLYRKSVPVPISPRT